MAQNHQNVIVNIAMINIKTVHIKYVFVIHFSLKFALDC